MKAPNSKKRKIIKSTTKLLKITKKLYGFKLIYFERNRIVPFTNAHPSFTRFKIEVFKAFPLLTQQMRKSLYFVWFLDDEQIIVRRDIEFKFAIQHFYEQNKIPAFKLWFEDNDDDDNNRLSIQVTDERTRNCLPVDAVIPVIDF